jgi:hypothetical protein
MTYVLMDINYLMNLLIDKMNEMMTLIIMLIDDDYDFYVMMKSLFSFFYQYHIIIKISNPHHQFMEKNKDDVMLIQE